jgi:hypothetical protein
MRTFSAPLYPENATFLAPDDADFVENGSRNTLGHVPYSFYDICCAQQ